MSDLEDSEEFGWLDYLWAEIHFKENSVRSVHGGLLTEKTKEIIMSWVAHEANKAVIAKLEQWASFFDDPSMDATSVSERLRIDAEHLRLTAQKGNSDDHPPLQ